ncbi:hypothetical protein NPIL_594411, partial [Nephila pilipes]
MYACYTSPWE